jgi:hypothetical protein
MSRVAVEDGYLPAALARRWISDDAWALLGDDVIEIALVSVVDSETAQRSTIFGNATPYKAFMAGLKELAHSDDMDTYSAAAGVDLSPLLPLEREGHISDWIDSLTREAARKSSLTSWGGYL